MVDFVGLAKGTGTLARQEPSPGLLLLVSVELRLAAETRSTRSGSCPAVICPLHDPCPLVLGQGAKEGDEATADRRGQIKMRLVQDLDQGATAMNALDDVDTIEHAPRGAVPLSHNQNTTCPELVASLLELRPVLAVSTTGLFSEDH